MVKARNCEHKLANKEKGIIVLNKTLFEFYCTSIQTYKI